MRLKVKGEMDLSEVTIEGLRIGEWTDVDLEVHREGRDGEGVRIVLTGIAPSGGYRPRREMAELHIGGDGEISVSKPIYRPNHDHDDSVRYHEVRGVTNNPSGRSGGHRDEDSISEHALTVFPEIVDY